MLKNVILKIWLSNRLFRLPKKVWSKNKIAKIVNKRGPLNAHFGSGPFKLKDWMNFDIVPNSEYYFDARERLPFADGIVSCIFSEHFIEHLTPKEADFWIGECFRVLKDSGKIRISTPGLKQLIRQYEAPDEESLYLRQRNRSRFKNELNKNLGNTVEVDRALLFNDKMRLWGGHKFIFDENSLKDLLEKNGFSNVTFYKYGESDFDQFKGLERHADGDSLIMRETIQLEATK